jgi:hypothetical protein
LKKILSPFSDTAFPVGFFSRQNQCAQNAHKCAQMATFPKVCTVRIPPPPPAGHPKNALSKKPLLPLCLLKTIIRLWLKTTLQQMPTVEAIP